MNFDILYVSNEFSNQPRFTISKYEHFFHNLILEGKLCQIFLNATFLDIYIRKKIYLYVYYKNFLYTAMFKIQKFFNDYLRKDNFLNIFKRYVLETCVMY